MKHQETLRCRVTAFNFSPKGGVEGLLVVTGRRVAQIVFPHDTGTECARGIVIGKTIEVVVEAEPPSPKGEAAHPVYRFVSMPQSDKADGAAASSSAITGVVARLNFARHGEANGVVLDSGDFVHLKPDGMRKAKLKVGDRVEADGETWPMDLGGRIVEATTVNGMRLKGKH